MTNRDDGDLRAGDYDGCNMAWLLPSYNRPVQCQHLLDQLIAVGCTTPGHVIVNGVDDTTAYRNLRVPAGWTVEYLKTNIGCCGAMQHYVATNPNEGFYGLICDDEFVSTPGWDVKLIEAAGDRGISHGAGWQSDRRLHNYVTFGGDLVRAIGFWALPGLWHWYCDDVHEAIAAALGNAVLCPDVRCDHRHYLTGKSSRDATYEIGASRAKEDRDVFTKWKRDEFPSLIERLTAEGFAVFTGATR